MLVFTSVTKSYLPKARVLAKSIKRFHPDWTFVLLLSDDFPAGFDPGREPFDEILTIEQLGLPDWKAWAFGHSIVELCTAVKGPGSESLATRAGVGKVMFIDPDIKVYNSLAPLDLMLDQYDILLTPHLLDPENDIRAIMDNEISALKHGAYNLGFFAARTTGQGMEFIRWWAERLRLFCRSDIPGGLFTDQRWCDLAPAFFSNLGIVRDRGFNVATWNIAHRQLSKDAEGVYFVAGVPLRFYHFTGYDSGDGLGMLKRYAKNQKLAHELWNSYGKELLAEGQGNAQYNGWYYGQYDNGESITPEARRLYQSRQDLQNAFPDPYSVVEPCFLSWWKAEIARGNLTFPNNGKMNQRTIIGKVKKGILQPGYGFSLVKAAMGVLKSDGIKGLIRRIRDYES
jgi:hypothetical protein